MKKQCGVPVGVWGAGVLMLALSGCAGWLPTMGTGGLATMNEQVGPDGPVLQFGFELGDDAGLNEQAYGAGYIVVSEGGREIQALPHGFEMPKDQIDRGHWLSFKDFNGDGWQDFVVTRMLVGDGQLPVNSLYQFDPKTRKFVQVEPLSNIGQIAGSIPGCVEVKSVDDRGAVKQDAYCFSARTASWTRQSSLSKAVVSDLADARCSGVEAGLIACRKSRIELDRQLLTLVREVRNERRGSLERELGKRYASSYVMHMDRNHRTWLLYRDARCTAQVREQAVPVNRLGAAVESCRFEHAREQLSSYKRRLLKLATAHSR